MRSLTPGAPGAPCCKTAGPVPRSSSAALPPPPRACVQHNPAHSRRHDAEADVGDAVGVVAGPVGGQRQPVLNHQLCLALRRRDDCGRHSAAPRTQTSAAPSPTPGESRRAEASSQGSPTPCSVRRRRRPAPGLAASRAPSEGLQPAPRPTLPGALLLPLLTRHRSICLPAMAVPECQTSPTPVQWVGPRFPAPGERRARALTVVVEVLQSSCHGQRDVQLVRLQGGSRALVGGSQHDGLRPACAGAGLSRSRMPALTASLGRVSVC